MFSSTTYNGLYDDLTEPGSSTTSLTSSPKSADPITLLTISQTYQRDYAGAFAVLQLLPRDIRSLQDIQMTHPFTS